MNIYSTIMILFMIIIHIPLSLYIYIYTYICVYIYIPYRHGGEKKARGIALRQAGPLQSGISKMGD